MNFEEMTNAELVSYCEENEIEVESKGKKPNKTELLAAVGVSGTEEDEFLAEAMEQVNKANATVKLDKEAGKLTKAQIKKEQFKKQMALQRVLITDNSDNQTKTDLMFVSWGNRILGYHTDRVLLGKPWHVRTGAMNNLRDATIYKPVQDDKGVVTTVKVPKYNIVDLGLLSEAEYKVIGEKQKIRNASLAESEQL